MQRRLSDALGVYVDAMRYPPGTENQRAAMWLEHTRRRGWQAVAAVEVEASGGSAPSSDELSDAPLLGVAYGYCGAPDQWWQQQVVAGLERSGFPAPEISKLMTSYFELTELHIHPRAQGRGLGEALARRLLSERSEANVLLSTPEITWRGQSRLAALPATGLPRRHSRLPLHRRPTGIRDSGPPAAAVVAPVPTRSGTMTWCAPAVYSSCPGVLRHVIAAA